MINGSTVALARGQATQFPNGHTRSPRAGRKAALAMAVSGLCLVVAACGGSPKPTQKVKFSEEKYGVSASPRMVADNKPVPKGGGRYMVGKPYTVAGKRYHPKHDPNYESVGLASWYGPTFHGRLTANGEIFDRNAITAAHTTMPLPSYARVTNLQNGRSLIVRVNDRGPFHDNRTIDLSERSATMLGTKSQGVAKVKVEYLGRARMDGEDEAFLMASFSGPGATSPGSTMPHTQLAAATLPGGLYGLVPAPRPRPYPGASGALARASFDPADAMGPATRVAAFDGPSNEASLDGRPLGFDTQINRTLPPVSGTTFIGSTGSTSSFAATRRITQAHAIFANVGGGVRLSDLANGER